MHRLFLPFFFFLTHSLNLVRAVQFPPKIYGVNLGSWLVLEAWMLPQEWKDMGGQMCNDCSKCIATEFEFAKAFPNTVDDKFNQHWNTWFNASDVQFLVDSQINTVRVPLGFWIIEDLVDRSTEFYPRGGINQLRRGLTQLRDAGIIVLLDHHALPGVQTAGQMFTGRCTNDVEFYTQKNYHRALIWTAVMAALSHLDPVFATVAGIEAVNEPIMDANQTPGYGDFQKNYVQVIRAIELSIGISPSGMTAPTGANFTTAVQALIASGNLTSEVQSVLNDALPIISKLATEFNLPAFSQLSQLSARCKRSAGVNREPLITTFMDVNWQFNNPSNPANAAMGPQNYDNHLYYSFGGVADPNEDAYLTHSCNLDRIQQDANLGNTPLMFGEWALSTQFDATDDFLKKWADAQKLQYSKGAGWIFWNFKIEISNLAGDTARQWSYMEGIRRGYFTKDPSQLNDPHVCDSFVN